MSSLVDILNNQCATDTVTDTSNLGPFYTPDSPMLEIGGDLIGDNEGEPVVMSGRVVDQDGVPVAGALLDIWQTAEIFVEDDRYIDEDAEVGVRGTLAVAFSRNDSAGAAAEHRAKAPIYEVTCNFGLQPAG